MKPYRQNWGKRLLGLVLIVGMARTIVLFVWWLSQKESLDTAQAFLDAIQRLIATEQRALTEHKSKR